ncbi:MAG: diacylglycerol/lipid kinase family protein [Planctomycetota bacterium]|jgi:diacylglycerol kinase family enzyme
MRTLLIQNPGSRAGRGRRLWDDWTRELLKAGVLLNAVVTKAPGHARRLAREKVGYDTVVAVGGDGTINEVMDGILVSRRPQRAMGILYAGTSPDFCRFHGIPVEPRAALETLLARRARRVDAAEITCGNGNGGRIRSHFACSSNIGLGAEVARESNRIRWFLGDTLGTGYALLRALALHRQTDLELEIDGETVPLPRANHVIVAKNPHIASGLKLDLDLRPDDGRLFVLAILDRSVPGMVASLPGFYTGSVTSARNVFLRSCRSVAIRSPERREIEYDGDPRGFLPARIELKPRALRLIGANHE